jgi:hypothetical protein
MRNPAVLRIARLPAVVLAIAFLWCGERIELKFHPMSRGFDEFFGFLGGAHSYMDTAAESVDPILDGRKPATAMTYLTDALATRALHQAREGASLPALSGVQCRAHADARGG